MTVQLTKEGYDKIQNEYKDLVEVKKPYAVDRLGKARSMGDLKENSEYSAAKDELAFVEGRIREIEEILKTVEVINKHTDNSVVELGNFVTVETQGKTEEYQIVGEFESEPMNKKLSSTSPIGKALIDKKIGDIVEVEIPAGKIQYKIVNIK
jgi:transcription elongation factor GreA